MTTSLVLCYHGVSESWEASEAVTPDALERQLRYLLRRGWRAATFSDVVAGRAGGRVMAITFDDALASVKRCASPIIEQLRLTATVFAPTTYVTSGQPCSWTGLDHWSSTPHVDELSPMSWQDLGTLADSGWEIASHTCTHPRLTELDDVSLQRELEESRQASVSTLGRPFATIAYPYGDVDARVAEFARRAGYTAGASLGSDLRDRGAFQWPRVGIYRRDVAWRFRLKAAPLVRKARASQMWGARHAAVPTGR